MGYQLITPEQSIEFDDTDGHRAVMAYCREVTAKRRALLVQTFDDALPNTTLQGPKMIASYPQGPEQEAVVRRAARATAIEAAVESLHQGSALRRHRDNEGTEHDDTLGPNYREGDPS